MQDVSKKTILLVDDDIEFVNFLSEKIKAAGMDVVSVVSGKEALDYITNHDVDFIVLDFVMPEMDGYTFYHIMKHDMRKNIPTIVLTNLSGNKEADDLEVYIKTETDLNDLVSKIKACVS